MQTEKQNYIERWTAKLDEFSMCIFQCEDRETAEQALIDFNRLMARIPKMADKKCFKK